MRAVQVISPGAAAFVDAPDVELVPGAAVVRPVEVSLCGSDVWMLHHAPREKYPFPAGTTGHEVVAVVESVDESATDLRPGDLVLALAPGHLAMAERYLADPSLAIRLPEGRPVSHLLQAQQFGTVIYAARRLPEIVGRTVAVIGQGSAGLWFDFWLRRLGASRVIAIDLDPLRLELAPRFGATHVVEAAGRTGAEIAAAVERANGGELADVVVEAAGEPSAIRLAPDLVRREGLILWFGLPRAEKVELDVSKLFFRCVKTIAIVGSAEEISLPSTRLAVDLIASGEADPGPLISHRVPFERTIEAYEMHRTRADGAVKIVIEMPGG